MAPQAADGVVPKVPIDDAEQRDAADKRRVVAPFGRVFLRRRLQLISGWADQSRLVAYRDSVETVFLNVDLDVEAAYDLAPLANALTPAVHVLSCEKVKRGYFARLELARQPRTPDEAIRKLTSLVARLPAPARRLWSRARKRDFSIGVQSGSKPWCSEFPLRSDTMAAAARVGARVVLTVYGEPGALIGPDGVCETTGRPPIEMQRTRPAQAIKPRR